MSGQWWFSAANWLTFPAGSFVGNGAHTLVALARPDANNARFISASTGATEQQSLYLDTSHLYGPNDFTAGFGTLTVNGTVWYVVAVSKPAGAAHYRFHYWPYASDGSGTMTHGESASSANHADFTAASTISVGKAIGGGGNGLIALAGAWDRELSDAELDSLKTKNLTAWTALAPKFLASLQNWNGTTGAVDVTGNSGAPTLTGSIDAAANPPGFDFASPSIVQLNSGTSTGTAFTPTLPVAPSAGNTLILMVAGNTLVNTLAGWNLRISKINQMGHYLFDRTGTTAQSFNFTNSAGQITWVLLEIRGGAYDSSAAAENSTGANSFTTPALTPAAGQRLLIASLGSTSNVPRTISNWTGGFVEKVDLGYAGADYPMQGFAVLDALTANGSTAYSTTADYSTATGGRSAIIASYAYTPAGGGTPAVTAAYSGAGTASAALVEIERAAAGFTGSGSASAAVVEIERTTAGFNGSGQASSTSAVPLVAPATGSGTASATVSSSGGTASVSAAFSGSGSAGQAPWLNHLTVLDPAAATHVLNPAAPGTVLAGAAFTPTAGRLLLCIASAAATSSTPAGWTLPAGASAINNTGLYAWWKVAAGGDTLSTTNNNAHAQILDVYEFPVGAVFVAAAGAGGVNANGGAGPALSGLSGANLIMAVAGQDNPATSGSATVTFAAGGSATMSSVNAAVGLDGVTLGVAYLRDSTLAGSSIAATFSNAAVSVERLMIAVTGGLFAAATGSGTASATVSSSGGIASASASFSGAGSASATSAVVGLAAYSGSGTASAALVEIERATASYSGAGQLGVVVVEIERAAALFGAAGSAAAVTAVTTPAAFAGSGAASASVSAVSGGAVVAQFTGSGAASAALVELERVVALFAGTGTSSALLVEIERAAALFTGSGSSVLLLAVRVPALFTGSGSASATIRVPGFVKWAQRPQLRVEAHPYGLLTEAHTYALLTVARAYRLLTREGLMWTRTVTMKQNDTAPALLLTAADGYAPMDIAGASCRIIARSHDPLHPDDLGSALFERSVTGQVGGQVRLDWQDGDLAQPGQLKIEVEVAGAGGRQTFPADGYLIVVVTPELG